MIRVTTTFKTQPIDELREFSERFGLTVAEAGDRARRAIEGPALDELAFTPRKRSYPNDYPLEWASERQRRAYFATNGFGKGIPYQRTGRAARSWQVDSEGGGLDYRIIIRSTWPQAKYLYGTLNMRSLTEAKRPVQLFHQITGWQPAQPTVKFWLEAAIEEFGIAFMDIIGDDLGSWQVTRRSRR